MKACEIIGGCAYICDCCEIDDGRPILRWKEKDFDLCFECLDKFYKKYLLKNDKKDEKIIIKRMTITEKLRNKIFGRDGNKCRKCGTGINLQIDHIVPFSKGGKTTPDNLQTLCRECNIKKRDNG